MVCGNHGDGFAGVGADCILAMLGMTVGGCMVVLDAGSENLIIRN